MLISFMIKSIESTIWGKSLNHKYVVWIYSNAIKLGLSGIVFFKNDGSIKIIAEGEENNLLFFIKKLKRGRYFFPIFSQIESFSVVWQEPKHEFEDFSISEALE